MKRIFFILIFFTGCIGYDQISPAEITFRLPHSIFKNKEFYQSIQSSSKPPAPTSQTFTSIENAERAVWKVNLSVNFLSNEIIRNRNGKIRLKKEEVVISIGSGSGFFISPDLLITNFHVIDGVTEDVDIILEKNIGRKRKLTKKAYLLEVSSVYDLALLKVNEDVDHYLNIRKTPVDFKTESKFHLIGYPSGIFVTTPLFYKESELDGGIVNFSRYSSIKGSGSSGGAVVDSNGEVIGVNYAGSDTYSSASAISTKSLNDFLNGNSRECEYRQEEVCIDDDWYHLEETALKGDIFSDDKLNIFKQGYGSFKNARNLFKKYINKRDDLHEIQEDLFRVVQKTKDLLEESEESYRRRSYEAYKRDYARYSKSYDEFEDIQKEYKEAYFDFLEAIEDWINAKEI